MNRYLRLFLPAAIEKLKKTYTQYIKIITYSHISIIVVVLIKAGGILLLFKDTRRILKYEVQNMPLWTMVKYLIM